MSAWPGARLLKPFLCGGWQPGPRRLPRVCAFPPSRLPVGRSCRRRVEGTGSRSRSEAPLGWDWTWRGLAQVGVEELWSQEGPHV